MWQRVKRGLVVTAARGIFKGIILEHSKQWDIAMLQDMAGRVGVEHLVPRQFWDTLAQQGEKYPELAALSCQEFLEWIKEGNPELFGKMAANTQVMDWLVQGWTAGVKRLFRTENA